MLEHTPNSPPKTALITGAARRIGATLARALHAAGMNLAIHYHHSTEDALRLKAELEAKRANSVCLIQADLLAEGTPEKLITDCLTEWGRLDVLINNASSFYQTPIGEIDARHCADLLGTNLKAPLLLSQAAAPALKTTQGVIINMVDIHARRPLPGYSLYCAAKAGLIAVTQSLARELGPEIRVNAIAPGYILSPDHSPGGHDVHRNAIVARTALRREGSPTDIAKAVLFLVQDADFISGEVLTVDGGRY